MRVLHLPTLVGNGSWRLSRAERAIGIDSDVLSLGKSFANYPTDYNIDISKNNFSVFLDMLKWFVKIQRNYDILHFNFGRSLFDSKKFHMNLLDLGLYKHKKVFFTYNGCDCRQRHDIEGYKRLFSPCHITNELSCSVVMCNEATDRFKANRIKKVSKYADGIFARTPDLLRFLPAGSIYTPQIADMNIKPIEHSKTDKFVIAHAPTDRIIKGTKYVLESVERLKKKYSNIEFILLENLTNDEALKALSKSDLVIDQMLVGWYGSLTMECMLMGIPVVAYLNEEDISLVPNDMQIDIKESIVNANIYNLCETLEELYLNRNLLKKYSEAGREYVNKWHNPIKIANLMKELYSR